VLRSPQRSFKLPPKNSYIKSMRIIDPPYALVRVFEIACAIFISFEE